MKAIFSDPRINHLASRCQALSNEIGIQRPAIAFVQAAIFSLRGEDRLYEDNGPCIGAIELELLGKRDDLLKAVCKARGINLRNHHLDRIAREHAALTKATPTPEGEPQ